MSESQFERMLERSRKELQHKVFEIDQLSYDLLHLKGDLGHMEKVRTYIIADKCPTCNGDGGLGDGAIICKDCEGSGLRN
jgi:hypothetical protein